MTRTGVLTSVVFLLVLTAGGLLWRYSPWPPDPVAGATHIIVDKWRNRLFLYSGDGRPARYSVATGRTTGKTPEGRFHIVRKLKLVPGRHNPQLGTRWLGLGVAGAEDGLKFGTHGTDEPSSIGRHVSGGCIRMHNRDIGEVYERVPVGTLVEIRPFPPVVRQVYDLLQKGAAVSLSGPPAGPGQPGCE